MSELVSPVDPAVLPGASRFRSRSSRILVVLALLGSMLAGTAGPARASCAVGVIPRDVFSSVASIGMDAAMAGTAIAYSLSTLGDALVKYSNNITMSTQQRNHARTAQADARNAQETGLAVAETRTALMEDLKPSVGLCQTVTQQLRAAQTGVTYNTRRTNLERRGTGFSLNAPGSGAERGQIQGLATAFTEHCQRYADPARMRVPQGVQCPGPADPALRNLNVEPWRALIDPLQFASAAREQAAEDAIKMLTELTPPDAVRGEVLVRNAGRNLHVLRARDTTRMNLARGVFQDMAAVRRVEQGQTHSRLARYYELVTGLTVDPATGAPGTAVADVANVPEVRASGDGENGSLKLVAANLATQQGMMFEIMRLTEQLVAIDAVELAMKVERTRLPQTSAAARVQETQ